MKKLKKKNSRIHFIKNITTQKTKHNNKQTNKQQKQQIKIGITIF